MFHLSGLSGMNRPRHGVYFQSAIALRLDPILQRRNFSLEPVGCPCCRPLCSAIGSCVLRQTQESRTLCSAPSSLSAGISASLPHNGSKPLSNHSASRRTVSLTHGISTMYFGKLPSSRATLTPMTIFIFFAMSHSKDTSYMFVCWSFPGPSTLLTPSSPPLQP